MKLLKRILVATDFSNTSNNVVENAMDMAKKFHSEITLIYVLPDDIKNKKANELLEKFATKQLDSMNDKIEDKDIKTSSPVLEYGNFSEKIIEVSEKINANIIFVGAGEKIKKNNFQLGSNAEKIIKKSNKPVFIVKNEKSLNIKKILCPVDFSDESKRALKNAITMAHMFKAELIIFSAFSISHLYSIRHKINMDEQIEYLYNDCKKEFDSFLEKFTLIGLKVIKEIEEGEPAISILNAIKKHKSDLLIIGTTGKSGISRILMGSVTEKVIRELPSSFITLKSEDVIILEFESKIHDIESHYDVAQQLFENGFFEDSINEFKKCLDISFMHIASLKGISKVYKKLGDTDNMKKYKTMLTHVLDRMYNEKIESEIRRYKNR